MYGREMYFDLARTKRELGWSARFGNVAMFCDSYDWYLRHRDEVLALLTEICRERHAAVLLVTHDPRAAAYADRVLALQDGRLVEYEPDQAVVPASAG